MIDYEISRCTRRCYQTGRELRPGEVVYSLLLSDGKEIVRKDCSLEAWNGPPEDAIGWWKTQLPKPDNAAPRMAPPLVIAQRFDQLVANAADPQLLTVMALLMVRKRILKEDEASLERKSPTWRLHCPLTDQTYEVPRVDVEPRRVLPLQEILLELLYGDEEMSLESLIQATVSNEKTPLAPMMDEGERLDVEKTEGEMPETEDEAERND